MKKYLFIMLLICVVLTLASFVFSYYIMDKNISEKPSKGISENMYLEDNKVSDENILSISKGENHVSPNTTIKYIIYYTECGHTLTKIVEPFDEIINMNQKQFEEYIKNNLEESRLISFSNKEIIIEKKINSLCPNHFIIGETNGKIAIYKINEKGEKILDKILENSSIKMLKDIDQQKLKNGIRVDSEEELTDVLENFIS